MRKEDKHKAIAIPVTAAVDGKPPRFLTVRDRRYQEWTFVTGGCRKREITNPLRCAVRELEEETRGTVNLRSGVYSYFNFNHSTDITYHVYILEFDISKYEQMKLINKFNYAKGKCDKMKQSGAPVKIVYDENDMMTFESLSEFSNRENVWPLIRKNVLENPEFYVCLNSANRKLFNFNDRIKSVQS
jgi:ADP-ribose pyrophosphatase YjhB (NUDIX family)